MDKRHSNIAPVAAIALLLLPGLYLGCYLALLHPEELYTVVIESSLPDDFAFSETLPAEGCFMPLQVEETQTIYPVYRIESEAVEYVFRPLFLLDKAIRPARWGAGLEPPYLGGSTICWYGCCAPSTLPADHIGK